MRHFRVPIMTAAALVIGLAARTMREPQQESSPIGGALVARDAIDPERLSKVVIERDGTRSTFTVRDGAWWQVEPIEHVADGWALRQIAARVLKAQSVRSVSVTGSDDPALAAAGLAPAVGRLELVEREGPNAAGRRVVIELGKRSLAGRAYARVVEPGGSASKFEVVDGMLHDFALERDIREFRRRDLFPDLGTVDRVAFMAGPSLTSIEREGKSFVVSSPVKTRADRQQCEELVDALRRARSGGFIVDNPADLSVYGLEPAAAVIEVRSGSSTTRVRIGDPVSIGAQDRFGLVEGTRTVVRIPALAIAGMVPRADRLIDAAATGVRARDVGSIEIRQGEALLAMRRETDRWTASASAPESGERKGIVDREIVERLLATLTEARAGKIELAAFPAERARATVVLRGFAGEALDTVRIAASEQGGVILENGDGVLRVHGALDLPISAAELGFTPSAQRP